MTKKKWIVLSIILSLVGGLGMFGYTQKEKEAREARRVQKEMALYVVNHYEGVESIKFESYSSHLETGLIDTTVMLNSKYKIRVTYWGGSDFTIDELFVGNENQSIVWKQKVDEQSNLGGIEVQYWEK